MNNSGDLFKSKDSILCKFEIKEGGETKKKFMTPKVEENSDSEENDEKENKSLFGKLIGLFSSNCKNLINLISLIKQVIPRRRIKELQQIQKLKILQNLCLL